MELKCGDKKIERPISTVWDRIQVGRLELTKGMHEITLRASQAGASGIIYMENVNDQTWFDRAGNFIRTNYTWSNATLHLAMTPYTMNHHRGPEDIVATAFTRAWKGEVPLTKARGRYMSYACHKGNYSLVNMLKGARTQEKEAAK